MSVPQERSRWIWFGDNCRKQPMNHVTWGSIIHLTVTVHCHLAEIAGYEYLTNLQLAHLPTWLLKWNKATRMMYIKPFWLCMFTHLFLFLLSPLAPIWLIFIKPHVIPHCLILSHSVLCQKQIPVDNLVLNFWGTHPMQRYLEARMPGMCLQFFINFVYIPTAKLPIFVCSQVDMKYHLDSF